MGQKCLHSSSGRRRRRRREPFPTGVMKRHHYSLTMDRISSIGYGRSGSLLFNLNESNLNWTQFTLGMRFGCLPSQQTRLAQQQQQQHQPVTVVIPPTPVLGPMPLDPALKARRESASQIDEFFEEAVDDGGRGLLMGLAERFSSLTESRDWEDITTSLSKIDPDNAEMLELGGNKQQTNQVSSVKIEPRDDHCPMENGNFGHHHHHGRSVHANGNSSSSDSSFHHHPASMMAPTTTAATSAINKGSLNHHCIQRFNYSNGFLPPTPPSSDPGSPSQDSPQRNNKPPPPPYSALLGPRTKQPSSSSSSSSSTSSSSSSGGSTQETDKPPTSNYFFFPSFSLLFFLFKSIE